MNDKTCLVTKYKKVVNNNNLKKRGVLVVHMSHLDSITNTEQCLMQIRSQVPSTVTVLGGGYVTENINHTAQEDIRAEGTKQIELQANRLTTLWFYNSPEPYDVEITNKYDLDYIKKGGAGSICMPYVDLEDLRYLTNLKEIGLGATATFGPFDALSNMKDLEYLALDQVTGNIYGNIDILSRMTNLWALYLPSSVTGSFQSISNILPNLVRLSCIGNLVAGNTSALRNNSVLISCYLNSVITGNLSDFSGCSSTLESLSFAGATGGDLGTDLGSHIKLKSLYLSAGKGLTGSIEDFVSRQKTAGRTSTYTPSNPPSTAIVGSFLSSGFTFGGNVIECPIGYYVSWLAWEGNKIIIYQGRSNTDFSSYAYVYAKGATSTEITAWRNAGKTVTVIS